MKNPNLFHPRN